MSRDGVIADLTADGRPPSLYADKAPGMPSFPPPTESGRADAVVIGGGLAGLSTALHLARHGRDVALVEAARFGAGASGRNGGQVHTGQRPGEAWLERTMGGGDARRLWALGEAAKALARDLAAADPHGCFLAEGLIGAAHTSAHFEEYRADAEHLATFYGYEATEILDGEALAAAIGTRRYVGGIRDRGAFHLDPFRFVCAIARAAAAAGARLHEGTRATGLSRTGGRWQVATDGGPHLEADTVVVAANGYLGRLVPEVAAHVLPINNFIAATAPLPEEMFAGIVPGGEGVFDSRFVIRYWRPTFDRRIAFGGGESTGGRFPQDVAALVRPYLLEIYPQLQDAALEYAWGGTLAITPTRAPYIRRLKPGLYTACGFSGQGVGTAPFAGKVVADAIAGDTAAFDVFARLPVPRFPGGTRLRRPLLTLALTWFALRDRLGV